MNENQCAASIRCRNTPQYGHRGMCYKHYVADQKQRHASGEFHFGYEPVEKVVAHLDMLLASGMTLRRIADQSGVSTFGLIKLRENKQFVRRNTAEALYAINPATSWKREEWGRIPPEGSVRRLRSLVALGYTQKELAKACGISVTRTTQLVLGQSEYIQIPTAKRIAEVFDRLQLTKPPWSRGAVAARNRAKQKGWPPPLAWDEESIDDIFAKPEKAVGDRDAGWLEDYNELRAMGKTQAQIAERWGIELDSLKTKMRRIKKKNASVSFDQEHE